MHAAYALVAALVASVVSAERIAIQVGANTTANASQIFQPQSVIAKQGDVVVFNFTNGTYDVIQATFDAPCIPEHEHNATLNGFNSGPRPANNGTAITTLEVPITDNFTTIWFYENSTCAEGGVGGININTSSTETLDGFARNAQRLNGTNTTSSASPSATGGLSHSSTAPSPTNTDDGSNSAQRNAVFGALIAAPLAIMALVL